MTEISTKNIKWIKHTVRIPITDTIEVERIDYYEEVPALTCIIGAYYDLDTNECLGNTVTRRKYLIRDGVELDEPVILPKVYWKGPKE